MSVPHQSYFSCLGFLGGPILNTILKEFVKEVGAVQREGERLKDIFLFGFFFVFHICQLDSGRDHGHNPTVFL